MGANTTTPEAVQTILSTFFHSPDNYYYNSATDNNLSADIGMVNLNGAAVGDVVNNQNTVLWYISNQSTGQDTANTTTAIRLGGLSGQGVVRNNFSDNVYGFTKLVFANTTNATFTGMIKDDWSGTSKLARIQVVMDGADNATQTIRNTCTSGYSVWGRQNDYFKDYSTIVKNGRLAIHSKVAFAKVKLEGGVLLAATEPDSVNTGELTVDYIDWEGGKVGVSLPFSDQTTKFTATNGINQIGGEDATYILEIDLSAFDEGYELEGESRYTIYSASKTFGDISKYGAEFFYKGVKIDTINGVFSSDGTGLLITMTGVVPEPSHLAAIFGIVALAIAAIRRRSQSNLKKINPDL